MGRGISIALGLAAALAAAWSIPADAQPARPSQTRAAKTRAAESAKAVEERRLEAEFWTTIQSSDDPADFRRYLARFPNGAFGPLAHDRLRALASVFAPPVADTGAAFAYVMRVAAEDVDLRPRTAPAMRLNLAYSAPQPQAMAAQPAPAPPAYAPPADATKGGGEASAPAGPIVVATAPTAPPPILRPVLAPPAQLAAPGDVLARPQMIAFEIPTLPAAFCSQEAMNSYLTDFHTPLDQAAKLNNRRASDHFAALNVRFNALIVSGPGKPEFNAVSEEIRAYEPETHYRYQLAARVNALDTQIRAVPIRDGSNCVSRAPTPPDLPPETAVQANPAAPPGA